MKSNEIKRVEVNRMERHGLSTMGHYRYGKTGCGRFVLARAENIFAERVESIDKGALQRQRDLLICDKEVKP